MNTIHGITLEQYADLGAEIAGHEQDMEAQKRLVAARGVDPNLWPAVVAGWTDRMRDVSDMGQTATRYMALYQAALTRKRGALDVSFEDFVALSAAAVGGLALWFGNRIEAAVILGVVLAFSSTAIVMQLLGERGDIALPHGQKIVAVLLFEDLLIVPLLALVVFMSPLPQEATGSRVAGVLTALAALSGLVAAGTWLLNPLFRLLARVRAREVMTAAALMVVLGAALLMEIGGLSMAMGAFLAGVLLSGSTFRHQLEADIEPFRGLLLGLFFLAVGMALDLAVVASNWPLIAAGVLAMMATKAACIYAAARIMRSSRAEALDRAVLMAQGGEFAFVLFSAAQAAGVIDGVARQIATGARVYWVCPLVEESEVMDLAAAEERFDILQARFGDRVGLVHGRLKPQEKDDVMEKFARGDLSILVATTVIEVGVNVPEATIMIIEHAERFGLAQLHQLRGRVGRGGDKSFCFLLYSGPLSDNGKARLATMRDTEDGFLIAEKDLELRGSGDILGTKQSGLPTFRLADLSAHAELLATARDDARLIIDKDPDLKGSRGNALRHLLYLFERDQAIQYLRSG